MKWLFIFGFLISVILFFLQQSMFFLSGVNPTVIMPFVLLIGVGITIFLLINAIKLYKNRDLKGQITTLQGFYFVLATFSLGFILYITYGSYYSFVSFRNVPRRYYSGDVNPDSMSFEVTWLFYFISYIKQSGYAFLFMAIISLIIAKIFSKKGPSVF